MSLRVRATELRVLNMWTRMPFRYGIATLTALPHLVVRAEVEVDGRRVSGLSADGLAPKWFTKIPDKDPKAEIDEMLEVIATGCRHAEDLGAVESPFDLWLQVYERQSAWGEENSYPPLLWHFGVTLIERAVIDAYCRAKESPFPELVQRDGLGMRLGEVDGELEGKSLAEHLPRSQTTRMKVRHTVGLADPLTNNEIGPDQRLQDGLRQSLEGVIKTYGVTHFKIKLPREAEDAISRLQAISEIVSRHCRAYAFTVDGNEFFQEVDAFREFWQRVTASDAIRHFLDQGLLFVEQPWHRDVALSEGVADALAGWHGRPPIIIDESDGAIESLPRALEAGYAGTSHKNCKGIFKGLANAALIEARRQKDPHGQYVISGEDLANVGPIALLQDFTVASVLGLEHVERNGHHYFAGLSAWPREVQDAVLAQHNDLYRSHVAQSAQFPTLKIEQGEVELGSLLKAPFGYGIDLDLDALTPVNEWRYESLTG